MKPAISGTTKLYGVIADPIEHVRVQALFNAYFEQHATDAVFVPIHVKPEGAAEALVGFRRMLNLRGVVVTIPHKVTFLDLVDEVMPTARLAGATNVIRPEPDGRWIGTNLDGMGFVNGLTDKIFPPARRSFLVVGCGGAGSAIAATLVQAGITRLTIAEVQRERAEKLAGRLRAAVPNVPVTVVGANPDPAGYDVAVNATPMGMHDGDSLPFDPARLTGETVVAEVVQAPPVTRLLHEARQRGFRTLQGGNMLDYQFIEMARFFRVAD
jgi:shikimate dehydrogenase